MWSMNKASSSMKSIGVQVSNVNIGDNLLHHSVPPKPTTQSQQPSSRCTIVTLLLCTFGYLVFRRGWTVHTQLLHGHVSAFGRALQKQVIGAPPSPQFLGETARLGGSFRPPPGMEVERANTAASFKKAAGRRQWQIESWVNLRKLHNPHTAVVDPVSASQRVCNSRAVATGKNSSGGGIVLRRELAHTAVCIAGQLRALGTTAKSIREHVLDALDADTFISTSEDGDIGRLHLLGQSKTAAQGKSRRLFRVTLFPSSARSVANDDLVAWFEELAGPAHLKQLQEFLSKTGGNYIEPLATERVKNSTAKRHGSGAFMMRHLHVCAAMIRRAENERGKAYRWVRFLRSDMYWRTDHVPLSMLNHEQNACYVPYGDAGFQVKKPNAAAGPDRAATLTDLGGVCTREAANAYMNGARLISHEPHKLLGLMETGKHNFITWTGEGWTATMMSLAGVVIHSLPDVEYLACECAHADDDHKRDCDLTPTRWNIGFSCAFDAKERVGFKTAAVRQHYRSRVWAQYVKNCGWSCAFLEHHRLARANAGDIDTPELWAAILMDAFRAGYYDRSNGTGVSWATSAATPNRTQLSSNDRRISALLQAFMGNQCRKYESKQDLRAAVVKKRARAAIISKAHAAFFERLKNKS